MDKIGCGLKLILIWVLTLMFAILAAGSAYGVGDYGNYFNTTIEIENAEGDIPHIIAGEIADLNITIKNIGDTDIEDMDVILLPTLTVITPLTSIRTLSELDEGESANLTFKICANDLEGTGAYPVSFSISYEDEFGRKEEKTLSVGVFIEKPESQGPPELRVTNVTLNPDILEPGEDLKLNISIKNVGDSEASNISVFLDTSSVPFAKIGYTRIYLEKLGVEEEKDIGFILASDKNALPSTYSIPLTITYYDYNEESPQQEQVFNELIGVETKGKAKLNIYNITTFPLEVKESEDFDLTFYIENIGSGSAQYCHVIVDFMGGEVIKDKEIGQIRPNEYKSVGFYFLNFNKTGTLPYKIMVSYEDDRGEHGFSKNMTLTVQEKEIENIPILVAIGVVLVVFIIIMLSKTKKGK